MEDSGDETSIASCKSEENCSIEQVFPSEDMPEQSTFGRIAVARSSRVHLGHKTYYEGPVTINHNVVMPQPKIDDLQPTNQIRGIGNSSFLSDSISANAETPNTDQNLHRSNFILETTKANKRRGIWWVQSFYERKLCYGGFCILLFLLITTIFISTGLKKYEESKIAAQSIVSNMSHKLIITRGEWLASSPKFIPLKTPVPYVIIWHTGTETCLSSFQCAVMARRIQNLHMEKWYDVAYSFLVGGDAYVYEGTGWEREGAHTYGYNSRSIGIACIGTFDDQKPPVLQLAAAQALIMKGIDLGYISKEYKLLLYSQVRTPRVPGKALFESVKTLPNWSPTP